MAFQNPSFTRALAHDMDTGEDTTRFQDRWACVASDEQIHLHPTQRGAEKRTRRAEVAEHKETRA